MTTLDESIAAINWLSRNAGASAVEVEKAERLLGARFSDRFKDFLHRVDGGNARIKQKRNICFFATTELPEINSAAAVSEFVPGWLIFASDLGGKSYLFRRNGDPETVVSCFDETLSEAEFRPEAVNLEEFLQLLSA